MEYGRAITITPTAGAAVQFNVPDADGNVLLLQEVQGFDSATMRTLVTDAPQRPGALVFPSEKGGTYPGLRGIVAATDPAVSFDMEQSLRRLHDAMCKDWALMEWTNADGVSRRMRVAASNFSIQGSIPKEFLIQMVSDQAQKDGSDLHEVLVVEGGAEDAFNNGDMDAWPIATLYGPWSIAALKNELTGITLELSGSAAIAADEFIAIDMYHETLYRNGDWTDYIGSYLSSTSDFWPVEPGSQSISLVTDDGGSAVLSWRDGWA